MLLVTLTASMVMLANAEPQWRIHRREVRLETETQAEPVINTVVLSLPEGEGSILTRHIKPEKQRRDRQREKR